jgi:F-type H+-transporting ATPase subunit b
MAEPAHTQESTEHAAAGGLPQFDPVWWPGQIVWVLIIFAVLYVLLSKLVLPRVGGAIENRAKTIANDIADARALRDEAQVQAAAAEAEVKAARAASLKTATEAKAKAAAEAAARDAEQEAELNAKLDAAEAKIRAARDKAMANVSTIAVETAQAITARLTGKAATEAEVKSALAKIA